MRQASAGPTLRERAVGRYSGCATAGARWNAGGAIWGVASRKGLRTGRFLAWLLHPPT